MKNLWTDSAAGEARLIHRPAGFRRFAPIAKRVNALIAAAFRSYPAPEALLLAVNYLDYIKDHA
jgi:hypothetical protein